MILNIGDPLYRPFPHGAAGFIPPANHENFLALNPQALAGGSPSSGLVGLSSPAPEGGTTVLLKTDRPDIVSVPKTITVAAKTDGARFSIVTHEVTAEISIRISMIAGELSRTNTLVLHPPGR